MRIARIVHHANRLPAEPPASGIDRVTDLHLAAGRIVGLDTHPDFRAEKAEPGDSDWAELRETQTRTLRLPNTGQAVIIDLGEGRDIHPRNKHDVAARLVRAGHVPPVLTAGALVGAERATELFEAAYDEHARRMAKLYEHLGMKT